jgi:hypothetical protein
MTVINEDKLTISTGSDPTFDKVKLEVLDALKLDLRHKAIDEEKQRIARSGVTYEQFRNLVSTVELKPFRRGFLKRTS